MWWTERERVTLAWLGLLALLGLGVLLWQQRRPPIGVTAGPPPPTAQWDRLLTDAKQVNVNRASAEELERLPQVGPTTAQRIVDYRMAHGAFRRAEELLQVPGIGPKTLEALRDYVTVQ